MNEILRQRVISSANIMLASRLTVRDVAKIVGLSKSTIHKDLTEKLPYINYGLYEEVEELLTYNKKIRHIRGGEKTKEKYQKMKVN
jgi:putative DeoR family transcriptional regulator (stage III sporulation protein D)